MLLSAVSVLVVAQSSSEIQEGLMNNPVFFFHTTTTWQFSVVGLVCVHRPAARTCWLFKINSDEAKFSLHYV